MTSDVRIKAIGISVFVIHFVLSCKKRGKTLILIFNADPLNIVVRYWCYGLDLWEFRQLNHPVNLQIMRAF